MLTSNPATLRATPFLSLLLLLAVALPVAATPADVFGPRHPEDEEEGEGDEEPGALRGAMPCVGGFAADYPCHDVDLQAVVPISELGGGSGSDLWGWTDPQTGREYAIVNRSTGTSLLDVTEAADPVLLGTLPVPGTPTSAGDVKVYGNYAFIVGERAADHGMQVFDLRRLRGVTSPETFDADAHYTEFGNAHNLALNEESGFAYPVRTNTCLAGLHMIDVRDPLRPTFAGCVSDAITHDAQCVTYRGGDPDYQGREICFNSNESHVGIVDVTDKSNPVTVARFVYDGLDYTHQGWLTEDHAFFLVDDEGDESRFGHNTRTYVINVEDLDAPLTAGTYTAETAAIDHNLYVAGDLVFQANYLAGLRILHIDDARTGRLSEIAYFDVAPDSDAVSFGGAWTAFPFFDSGNVLISSRRALYVVRPSFHGHEHCALALGEAGFCEQCGPCREGQGSCRTDDDCASGLVCAENFGAAYGLDARVEVCVGRGVLDASRYSAEALPAVEAGGGPLDSITGRAINNAGQAVGQADNADAGALKRTAFRFTPGDGMEKLDPQGQESSTGLSITEAGDVFGYLYAPGGTRQNGVFVHREGSGFDLLNRGSSGLIRQRFELHDTNASGDLVGAVSSRAGNRHQPYLYTAADGWTALDGLDPRFRDSSTVALGVNDKGDLLFQVELAGGEARAFALFGGDRLVELGDFGRRFNRPGGLNDNGRVAGTASTRDGQSHAYVLRHPAGRITDIHPRGFTESVALQVSVKGVVGGLLATTAPDGIFTWDVRRERKMRVEARRGHFRALLPDGSTFGHIEVIDVNERLEFVGRVVGTLAGGAPVERFFYYGSPYGLLDVESLVAGALAASPTVTGIADINDWGEILVLTREAGKNGALVLSPIDN